MSEYKKIPKLDNEISRLYRQGQNPIPYDGQVITEVMMMLYLSNKYNINNPAFDKIREKYKIYSRSSKRIKSKTEKPIYCIWELELFFNEKEDLIKSNEEEYTIQLYDILRSLIDKNPGKKVMCPFNTVMYNANDINGHIEIIMYDPALNIIEHVDSNNLPKQYRRKYKAYTEHCQISSRIVHNISKMLQEQPSYINNKDIYSGYDWGIQSMEACSDKLTEQEKNGYCLMWACLFSDLSLTFPDYSAKEIVEIMMKKASSKMNSAATLNDYFLSLIRGYVVELSKILGVDFADEESQHEVCSRIA